jgi:hypothetical protein
MQPYLMVEEGEEETSIATSNFFHIHYSTLLFFFLMGLGLELRASCLQSRHSTTGPTPPVYFATGILEMEIGSIFLGWA